jgi:uncharacterized membrane-anchored protein
VFGTQVTDDVTDQVGRSRAVTTRLFSAALIATFAAWAHREGALPVHAITTGGRQRWYWAAIPLTFALGTAGGDRAAEGPGSGDRDVARLSDGLVGATALPRTPLKANTIACFWITHVLTRPFGASWGDPPSRPVTDGGLGFGANEVGMIFLAAIAGRVIYLSTVPKPVAETER